MQATLGGVTIPARIELRYAVRIPENEWVCPEGSVPESIPHSGAARHLHALISFWASRANRPVFAAQNLAVRWIQSRPSVGIDPDVCLLDPPPPGVASLSSLCLWKPGHVAPSVSFEIVSEKHPYKDYVGVHERYAALGARELFVLDPLLLGPKSLGGPIPIQVWRNDGVVFERVYMGQGPAFSEVLDAWVLIDDGLPELSNDHAGLERWPTEQVFERTEKERERAARLDVERRLAELESRFSTRTASGNEK
jgi:hypothetical protein